ncbi:MAG: hypothetical protein PHP64_00300 [Actinomycetota bacterium]|nr:hypothetical protein [Actinomycetota bacterium]
MRRVFLFLKRLFLCLLFIAGVISGVVLATFLLRLKLEDLRQKVIPKGSCLKIAESDERSVNDIYEKLSPIPFGLVKLRAIGLLMEYIDARPSLNHELFPLHLFLRLKSRLRWKGMKNYVPKHDIHSDLKRGFKEASLIRNIGGIVAHHYGMSVEEEDFCDLSSKEGFKFQCENMNVSGRGEEVSRGFFE